MQQVIKIVWYVSYSERHSGLLINFDKKKINTAYKVNYCFFPFICLNIKYTFIRTLSVPKLAFHYSDIYISLVSKYMYVAMKPQTQSLTPQCSLQSEHFHRSIAPITTISSLHTCNHINSTAFRS